MEGNISIKKKCAIVVIAAVVCISAISVSGMTDYGYYNWGGFIANAGVDAWAYKKSGYHGAAARAKTSQTNDSGWGYGRYVRASVWVWPWDTIYRYHFFY